MDQLMAARAQLQATLAASNARAALDEQATADADQQDDSGDEFEAELRSIQIGSPGGPAAPDASPGAFGGDDAGADDDDDDGDDGSSDDDTDDEDGGDDSEEDEESDSDDDQYYCDLCPRDQNDEPPLITGQRYALREGGDVLAKKKLEVGVQKLCRKLQAESIEDLCEACFAR